LFVSGCSNLGYYVQSVGGHLDLVARASPVSDLLESESTSVGLRDRLHLSQQMREFSVNVLALPDNASYRRYADLGRPAAVWNVVATPEFSLSPKTWCFPVMGCVAYRGYFRREDADELAAELRQAGWEVAVYGVPAYSTLGRLPGRFFSDPLLNTFIRYPEGELARMIFHELAHQVAYAEDDTVFNESFATAVERIGCSLWLKTHASAAALEEYHKGNARREDFRALTARYRDRLLAIYQGAGPDEHKRAAKSEAMAALREEYRQLKAGSWAGFSGYDTWFERANNSSLATLSVYNDMVPQFEQLFEHSGRDFARFYASVKRLSTLPYVQRRPALVAAAAGLPWEVADSSESTVHESR
jgi:predicted aminopeptidase